MINKSMKNFYVYVYMDPRKPGPFTYGYLSFSHEPFYIGKGRGERIDDHITEAKYGQKNSPKLQKIRKILSEGTEPIREKFCEKMSEDMAFYLEKWLIKVIGRKLHKGPLTNGTDGGEGKTGPESEATKLKKSLAKLGEKNNFFGKTHTEEVRQLLREKCPHKGSAHPLAKTYIFITPTGEEFTVIGRFKQFCQEHSISRSTMQHFIDRGKVDFDLYRQNPRARVSNSELVQNCLGWEVRQL